MWLYLGMEHNEEQGKSWARLIRSPTGNPLPGTGTPDLSPLNPEYCHLCFGPTEIDGDAR